LKNIIIIAILISFLIPIPVKAQTWNPVIFMKGKINGNMYIPDAGFLGYNLKSLKIDFVFTEAGVEGDQTGGTSPYPLITTWPEGKVDIRDVSLISQYYGEIEGQTAAWDEKAYVADVVPDRKIDIRDSSVVSANYGNIFDPNVVYSSDLTGVTVEFFDVNGVSLGVETPNAEGLISIPTGAWTFTVYKNGVGIGAGVTFSEQEIVVAVEHIVDLNLGFSVSIIPIEKTDFGLTKNFNLQFSFIIEKLSIFNIIFSFPVIFQFILDIYVTLVEVSIPILFIAIVFLATVIFWLINKR